MSRRRAIPLVLGVVALLAVVAIVAVGEPLGNGGGSRGGLPQTFWNFAFTTLLIVLALMFVVAIGALSLMRRERFDVVARPFGRRTARSIIVLIAVAAIVTFVRFHFHIHIHKLHQHGAPPPVITSPPTPVAGGKAGTTHTQFEWPELAVVLGAFLALALVYGARRRSLPPALRPAGMPPEELLLALDESLDDLRSDPDLRRAIVAAYARMERSLAAAGVPRDPAEAPLEYVERVLLSLDTSAEAVRRLTDLFEWARFSHHEPEPSMRDEAVDALVAVRDELRGREPVKTW